ncbi:Bug family tripartite tricarboxylate transporter substrate binding protein [Schauerella aestuarii]|uniref:Bug family tripartite tricarboxylate transporter substrate binding protein n=1 Tax=Schauerella aestuarii TaxID=2511204 RepID=UPI00136A00C0|nr:tripartite tricarboxylate transporter substrate binding protein [Achromobacter aestuarii]MYZ41698.1 tripartite tricarboxylate transporter substrate binding protein [Achromobacter aestuarii]
MFFRVNTALCAALLLPALGAAAQAADYPVRPINVVVPMPPGGGTDTITRLLVERMGASTGWNLVVQNKPGATGNIGMDFVARAEPDGYAIGMGQAANLAINPALFTKMPFDPTRDFSLIGLVAAQPVVLVVNSQSPYKTVADLIADAKGKPAESLRMASAGNGTIGHMSGMMLAQKAGVTFLHVPYKGAGPVLTELAGGQTDFAFITPQSLVSMLAAGKLRAIAVTSKTRLKMLPDVPTVAESGYPGFEASAWTGLVGPKDMKPDVLAKLNEAMRRAVSSPEIVKKLEEEGSQPLGGQPQAFATYLASEQAKWKAVVKDANIKLD